MTIGTASSFLALLALSLAATPATATYSCPFVDVSSPGQGYVESVKGSITGTYYDPAGSPTKVKCPATIVRYSDDMGNGTGDLIIDWTPDGTLPECAGLNAFGDAVTLTGGEVIRIVNKSAVSQKSCVMSGRYQDAAPRESDTYVGVVTTRDVASPTTLVKEKGTLNLTRADGVFSGKVSVTYPAP